MGLFGRIGGLFKRSSSSPPSVTEHLQSLVGDGPVTGAAIREVMAGKSKNERKDAWQNILTMLGTRHDKRTAGEFILEPVTDIEAQQLWRGDDISKRVIETRPREALRRGYSLHMEDKKRAEDVMALLEDLDLNRRFVLAGQYENAYGGAALFPVLNDLTSDVSLPLNEDSIHDVRHVTLFEPRELWPVSWYDDPLEPKWGEPEIYEVRPFSMPGVTTSTMGGLEIHESRLVIFPGVRVTRQQQQGCRLGWGDNRMTLMRHIARDYNMSWDAVLALMQEISIGVFKMEGLAELIKNDRDNEVASRMMQVDIGKGVLNAVVIGEGDSYERVTPNVSGWDSILNKFEVRMSSAADMQVTAMMGQSPAGMDATGESDLTIEDNRTESWQDEHRPQLQKLIRICGMLPNDGPMKGKEPDRWSIKYTPLRQPTEKEEAERRYLIAQTDQIYWTIKSASSDDIATSRWQGDTYSAEMTIDWEARKKQQAADEEAAKLAAEQFAAAASAPPVDPNADPAAPTPTNGASPAAATKPPVPIAAGTKVSEVAAA